ncbi:MAG TPA: methyltransferase domain-containing protein, partial [Candidatus Bathyarchaeia archaeon]|nr:methyltransferase domain-containing protein [Candidatus Bathyarchaeia archaeon]
TALPFYEFISEVISMGLAGPLRRRAIRRLSDARQSWVLDSGTGPGVSSRMLIESGFENVIGLDPSIILLRSAKARLSKNFYPVLGVAEHIPFRTGSLGGAITCFSLRDVRDRALSMEEFGRVLVDNGRLEIVDVGKPDDKFLRSLVGVYISLVMPVVARLFIGGRDKRNPFRMIIPTFHQLSTNRQLAALARRSLGLSKLDEFLFGGLVIVEAQRME